MRILWGTALPARFSRSTQTPGTLRAGNPGLLLTPYNSLSTHYHDPSPPSKKLVFNLTTPPHHSANSHPASFVPPLLLLAAIFVLSNYVRTCPAPLLEYEYTTGHTTLLPVSLEGGFRFLCGELSGVIAMKDTVADFPQCRLKGVDTRPDWGGVGCALVRSCSFEQGIAGHCARCWWDW